MYLLDTGVVSELRRPEPHPSLVRWITETPSDQLFLSAATLGEIQAGIENVRDWDPGSATRLEVWLEAVIESGAVSCRWMRSASGSTRGSSTAGRGASRAWR